MGTLLMQLVGPMQSWGVQSHFTHRDTGLEPSKSGVIGLLCAALGKPRDESHPDNVDKPTLASLAALRMGVRVDREGLVKMDYHTAKDVMKAGGKPFKTPRIPSSPNDSTWLMQPSWSAWKATKRTCSGNSTIASVVLCGYYTWGARRSYRVHQYGCQTG